MAGRKIFVGSLPDGVQELAIRAEFSRFGNIEDIFVKPGCEPGRQWAFVTYSSPEEAIHAKDAADRNVKLPGAEKACDVMLAKNQGKFGQGDELVPRLGLPGAPAVGAPLGSGARKVFVGSLPDSITEAALTEEFRKYGQIENVFLKMGNAPNKQWAFVTYSTADAAQLAKTSTDKVLTFPGSEKACEVMIARNQGLNGQDPVGGPTIQPDLSGGPVKVFVGSLPDNTTEGLLRQEFGKFGTICDIYLKLGCETGKQWAFITFAHHAQAQQCKDLTDRQLIVPGATGPVECMFARNQGKHGQDPLTTVQANAGMIVPAGIPGLAGVIAGSSYGVPGALGVPPQALPNGGWVTYFTSAGLPYYHNHLTNQTTWEAPPEIAMAAMAAQQQQVQVQAQQLSPLYGAAAFQAAAVQPRAAPY